jgi:anti-sigma B factor antagonist
VALSLHTRVESDRTVLSVAGEIDLATAPLLRAALTDLIEQGNPHLLVDLRQVDFLDCSGLNVLVGSHKCACAHEGSLELVITRERILTIFKITGLTCLFPIYASLEQAMASAPAD